MFALSGRQYRGTTTRTVVAAVGRAHRGQAKASLGSWWPVSAVADVIALPNRRPAVPLSSDDWSWSGGITLSVPPIYANQRVQATLSCGQDPPADGVLAAQALAVELLIADPEYSGDTESRLPGLITSESKQGVSQSFASVIDIVKEGVTGIQEVDQFISTRNPIRQKSRPKVRIVR